jgi:hypothetical protein
MSQPNVNELFKSAQGEGVISKASMQALTVVDVGNQIQNALGVPAIEVKSSEVILVTQMIDDSGSIRFAGNTQVVRDGHNLVIDSLLGSKQSDNVLMHTRYLNGRVLFPYSLLDQAIRMDSHNYNPDGETPLRDQTVLLLGTVLAKIQEFADNGVPCRTITLITTDGMDEGSLRATHKMIASIVNDMLMMETNIIAAMGIQSGSFDFRKIFTEFGVRDEWILTPANTQSEIRKAFNVFSKSAVRASQNAASFSQTAQSGFTKP